MSDHTNTILDTARHRVEEALAGWSKTYERARDDIRFASGERQWDEQIERERAEEGRPTLKLNRVGPLVDLVVGDARQNKIEINVRSKGGEDDNADIERADIYDGLIRNIQDNSRAPNAYDTALECAVAGGVGFFRVVTDYERPTSFEQHIQIKRIRNPFAVLLDPASSEPDGSDANYGFVFERMSRKAFRAKWPNAQASELASPAGDDLAAWYDDDAVKVADYYWREAKSATLALLSTGETVDLEETDVRALAADGIEVLKTRRTRRYTCFCAKITAYDILEGPYEWPSQWVPIIPVYGHEDVIDGEVIYRGLVRNAKDAQRMHNYWMSAATEQIALAPKSPFLATPDQTRGYEGMWETANRKAYSVLYYNETAKGAPQRSAPAITPNAEITMALQAADEIKATTNIFNASLGATSNETSGKAILARQHQGDVSTFLFADNLSRSVRHLGRMLIEMIPRVYDSERIVTLMRKNGDTETALINHEVMDPVTGKVVRINDLSVGEYHCAVTTGPAYATKRMETADHMLRLMQTAPDTARLILDKLAQNLDWPGADEIAKRFESLLPPELRDDKNQQPTPPDPKVQAEQAKAQADVLEAQAKMVEAKARMTEAQAKMAELSRGQPTDLLDSLANVAHYDADPAVIATIRAIVNQILGEIVSPVSSQPGAAPTEALEPTQEMMQ